VTYWQVHAEQPDVLFISVACVGSFPNQIWETGSGGCPLCSPAVWMARHCSVGQVRQGMAVMLTTPCLAPAAGPPVDLLIPVTMSWLHQQDGQASAAGRYRPACQDEGRAAADTPPHPLTLQRIDSQQGCSSTCRGIRLAPTAEHPPAARGQQSTLRSVCMWSSPARTSKQQLKLIQPPQTCEVGWVHNLLHPKSAN
jgi:hypothetical protein